MKNDRVFKLDDFMGGKRILSFTESGGSTQFAGKEGTVDIPYGPGSLVLFDDKGTIVGPLTVEGVRTLAERILDGDQRAATDPRALITLATAVTGFLFYPDIDEPAAAALETEVAHV